MRLKTGIKVVCDFDGTICPQDVLHELIVRFGDTANKSYLELEEAWSQELYRHLIEGLQFSPADMEAFLAKYKIDPFFPEFVRFCREKNWPLYVLSDGLDLYIKPLLAKENLSAIPVFCNRFLRGEDVPRVAFPYSNDLCRCCGNCKKTLLRFLRQQDKIIYVGDGHSDRCAAEKADLLFALGYLQEICRDRQISFIPIKHFGDVLDYFKKHQQDIVYNEEL